MFTDPIDGQMNPHLCTDYADPTPNICFAEDESVLIRNEMVHPAGHGADASDIESFMKRILMHMHTYGWAKKKDSKPRKWWVLTPD